MATDTTIPSNLREFDDTDKTRELIYGNVLDAVKMRFPVEDDTYRLELKNVRYTGPQTFTLKQQKDALLKDRNLHTPLSGTWRLVHKPTNKVVEERDDVVMYVPYYTGRGTIINRSNEYTVASQARLLPGVYVRKQRTGEIESHFNVAPEAGKAFRLHLEPKTGVFKVNVGQSSIPAYPLLNAVGVSDKQLADAWGPELLEANMRARADNAINKLYDRFAGYKADPNATLDDKIRYLKEALPAFTLDEGVTGRTLGIPSKGVTPDVLLAATRKMLHVSRGEAEADDRDSPMYTRVLGIEDLLRERVDKDAGKLVANLLRKVKRSNSLRPAQRGVLDTYVASLIHGSGLANPLDETNVLSTLEQLNRITKMGEGGIGSESAVTNEARDVNPGQIGYIDLLSGPEGGAIGVDVRAAFRTFKGSDQKLYGEFFDPKSKRMEYLRPDQTVDKVVAFPGELAKNKPTAVAMQRGKLIEVPKKEVDYEIPSIGHMYSSHVNLNAMPTGVQGGRQFYAAKFWSQYLPQAKGEIPLVDSLMPDGKTTYGEYYGRKHGTITSDVSGKVTRVDDNGVTITDDAGKKTVYETVKDFPFNRLSGFSLFPTVKVGDTVRTGDMIAHSNFTDSKTGGLNMGQNLKVAIVPYHGNSYEDAYVISDKAAQRLATERLHGFDVEARHGITLGHGKYISAFPKMYTKEQLSNIDNDGIVKPGTVVNKGDPIILAVGPKLLTAEDAQLGKLHKVLRNAFTDKSQVWEYSWPGIVTDAVMTRNGARVNIKSTPPVATGDKLAAAGIKGVVGKIVPEDKMPRDPTTNEPYELIFNPMTIQSRIAPNQIIEIALAKLAKKTGKQIRLPQQAPEEGWTQWAKKQLDEAGVSDTNDIFDPESGKTIKNIGDGYIYVHAFHHLAEKKLSHRGDIGGYDMNEQPTKGGVSGAKRMSSLDINALLAHGATEVIKDAQTVRGTKNEDYWKALKLGKPIPEPGVPFVYDKFVNTLKAGGVNLSQEGDITSLLPMTDDDVDQLAHGDVTKSAMVDDDFEPIKDGLFDVGKTGGAGGKHWTRYVLPEPIPNPVMEEPIRRILGLKVQELEDIIAGRRQLNGKIGGEAIKYALDQLDIDEELERNKNKIRTTRGAVRDNAIKSVGYLSAAKKQGIHPSKWVISKVPILPPAFRPVARMGDMALTADLNELYRDMIEAGTSLNELRTDLPDSDLTNERLDLYKAVKAAYGLGDPITPEGQSKRLKGAIRQVIGDSPKTGLAQARVFSKTVDLVGRGVVTPDPNLNMDQVGIPEDSAWTLYKDFVMRNLVRHGYPAVRAAEMISLRTPQAREILEEEMKARPVIMDRAPTWHKFNLMAFNPHIVEGHTVRVNPLITKSYTMDFDGDQSLNLVLTSLTKSAILYLITKYGKNFMEVRMASRFETKVPATVDNETVFVFDLEDFPHGDLIKRVEGEKGPIEFYAVGEGVKVLAYDELTGNVVWSQVTGWSKHYQREIEIVQLNSGSQILTDDDPRAVYAISNDDLTMKRYTPSEALTGNVHVPHVRKLNLTGDTELRYMDVPVHAIDHTAGWGQPAHSLKSSLPMDWNLGYIFGAMCGDGWIADEKCVCICGIESDGVLPAFKDRIQSLFIDPINPTITRMTAADCDDRYGDCDRYSFNSVLLAKWMLPYIGKLAKGKHLPPNFIAGPVEYRHGILAGLMDTDGSASVSNGKEKPQLMCSFSSTSLRMVNEVRMLALSLGIRATITPFNYRGDKEAWMLTFSAVDMKKWEGIKYMANTRKVKIIQDTFVADSSASASRLDNVPVPTALLALFKKTFSKNRGENMSEYNQGLRGLRNNSMLRRRAYKMIEWIGDSQKDNALFNTWVELVKNESIYWDRVVGVDKTGKKEDGYDLTVPGFETFLSLDGVVLSNTVNFHVPATDKASEEAKRKMLPSDNLFSLTDLHSVRYSPSMEMISGLYQLTRAERKDKKPQVFKTMQEAEDAYKAGLIGANDPIEILELK